MLKLKKVQILGFKSFCDRTEVQLSGSGIAAIVGPNGCGKSNISDAITWVLGEQSAKSLRGLKMEDVIFAGTRDRKPTGMAEVSLTLVDPEVYEGTEDLSDSPDIAIDSHKPTDWNESHFRAQQAEETEEAVLEAQPGQTFESPVKPKSIDDKSTKEAGAPGLDSETWGTESEQSPEVNHTRNRRSPKNPPPQIRPLPHPRRRAHHHPPPLPLRRLRVSPQRQNLPPP